MYLAFSPTRDRQWSVAIDSVNARGDDFGIAVFNGKYRRQFEARGIDFEFEKRNRTSGHLVIERQRVLPTIERLAEFDHSVLSMKQSHRNTDYFATEYDIQRMILFNWSATPFGKTARIIGDEVPVDEGMNPRRIDVLAKDVLTEDYYLIEIKRAEAGLEAIKQIEGYIHGLSNRLEYANSGLHGVLIAERIPHVVVKEARAAGITTFEIDYPFTFRELTEACP